MAHPRLATWRKQCHVCKRADIAGETHDAMAQGGRRTPSKAVEGWPVAFWPTHVTLEQVIAMRGKAGGSVERSSW